MTSRERNRLCSQGVTACAQGDPSALSTVYDLMARMIFSTAYAITGNYQDAEDVLQETFLQIARYACRFRPGTDSVAWILTIARHLSIDTVRRRKPTTPLSGKEEDPAAPFAQVEALELLRILEAEEKQLVLFRLHLGLSYREIAQIMEISVAAAQKRYQRAIQKLKKHL